MIKAHISCHKFTHSLILCYTHITICTNEYTHMCIHTCTCTCTHTHTHTCTHTHTHLHTRTQEIAQAYKDQNKFLSCEIVELNQLRSDDSDAIRSLNR